MNSHLSSIIYSDDEDRLREELEDLIDDNPIEESEGEDSDASGGSKKRKKSDDEDFDDRLEDEDYDLIEENLGVKVERVRTLSVPTLVANVFSANFCDGKPIMCFTRNASNVCVAYKTRNRKKSRNRRL